MPTRSETNFARRKWYFLLLAFLFSLAPPFTARAAAQDTATRDRIYVVTHIDTVPEGASASKLLQQYVAESRKDKGAVRVELYVQISRTNHFTLVEVWQNREAFEAHSAAAHTRQFREQIQPILGSPFDERLHQLVE